MKIGFIVYYKNTHNHKTQGVWGEEIIANALIKALKGLRIDCDVYTADELFSGEPLDIAIYLSDFIPKMFIKEIGRKNVLWIQGFNYGLNGKIRDLDEVYQTNKDKYDLIITASRVLATQYDIPFIFPGVDMEVYKPESNGFNFDMSYIGNLIKPKKLTHRYLSAMSDFNYFLAGGDFGKISHEKWLKVVSGSKINLHFGFEESIKWDMVTGRPFFISACNGFTLMDEVPFFMEEFKNAMGFTNGYNIKEQITYWLDLKNEKERVIFACRAYEIVKEKFNSESIGRNFFKEVLCTLF